MSVHFALLGLTAIISAWTTKKSLSTVKMGNNNDF